MPFVISFYFTVIRVFLRVVVEDFVQPAFVRGHRCLVVLYKCTHAEREVMDLHLD